MTQTCETCRYAKTIKCSITHHIDDPWLDCHGLPHSNDAECLVRSSRPACSLYRARVSDKEREAEEAAIWAAREQAQADVASMLGKAYSCAKPSGYNVKCTVTEPCEHEPKGMPWGGFDDVTNTCSKCGKRIMRDLGPWREEP